MINITVKTLDSRNYQFEAQDDWTVAKFKEHIQQTVDIDSSEQRLIFCGRVLQNDKKLTEYDCNGKVIHLVRRPPPTIGNPDRDSSDHGADSNNNSTDPSNRPFADDNNVLFSAMTLGPDGNINQILRQMMSLQQMMYSRSFGGQAQMGGNVDPVQEVARRLNNAARLLRIISRFIAESTSRLSNIRRGIRAQNDGLNAETPMSIISSASSHTNLQSGVATHSGNNSHSDNSTGTTSSDDSRLSPPNNPTRRRSRQSLTTDDIPQSTRSTTADLTRDTTGASNQSNIERYLQIMSATSDIQDQTQALVRRYLEIINVAHRGWLVPQDSAASTANSDRSGENQAAADRLSRMRDGIPPHIASLMEEGNYFRQYLPRIMHHISHLQHALSDLTFDGNYSRLNVTPDRSSGRTVSPLARRTRPDHTTGSDNSIDPSNQTIEGSLTITATTVGTTPIISTTSTSNLRPQASATIVLTSEPSPAGIHIPVSIPLTVGSHDTINVDIPFNQPSARRNGNQQQQQNQSPNPPEPRNPPANQDQSNSSDSVPSNPRPIGVISGRIPIPFDYYLTCFSPHTNHYQTLRPSTARRTGVPLPQGVRREFARRSQTSANSNANISSADASSQNQAPNVSPLIDSGLTEVVNNIVNSIFRPPNQPETQSERPAPRAPDLNQNQDAMVNFMPAINIASQILGNVFGISGNTPQEGNQESSQRQATASGSAMMDIDIDDGSSSHSESRYQDASDNTVTAASSAVHPSSSHQLNSSLPEHYRTLPSSSRYSRNQLLEVMQNHPDWIPIIEADISLMERYNDASAERTPYFSDAYLSSIPRKRRRLLSATPDRVLILQPSPSQAISNLLRRAMTNSNTNDGEALESVLNSIANDVNIQSAYEDYIKSAVEARLQSDYDYCPQKFENSSKYFK